MPIEYEKFRHTSWEERVAMFSQLSPAEKAELFRSQVSGWTERHRTELTPQQLAILQEAVELVVPELYSSPKPQGLAARMNDFENRARAVLTPEQAIEALTMQWGLT